MHRVAAGLHLRVVGPRPVGEAEPPVVPRAGDHPVLDVPAGERRPHVRAQVVDGEEPPAGAEHGHVLAVHFDDHAATFGDVLRLADRHALPHRPALRFPRLSDRRGSGYCTRWTRPRGAAVLEVEVKYRAPEPAAVRAKLLTLGAQPAGEADEADHYFNAPDRDFRRTDEAFRIRQTPGGTRLTYKGPRRETATKTRKEVEVPIGGADDGVVARMTELLVCLGYRPVVVVRKRRAVYTLERPVGGTRRPVEVCFDEVEAVGSFVEVEL